MRTFMFASSLLALSLLIGLGAVVHADTSPRPQIVGGNAVPDPNPYMYQVSIGTVDDNFCGGSLIAATWVLSAAHCFVDNLSGTITDASTLVVRVGLRSLSASTAENERLVSQLIVHPSYDAVNTVNDIALLKLSSAVTADWLVAMADTTNDATLTAAGTQSIATGWGGLVGYSPSDGKPTNGQQYPDILQWVQMPIVSNATCNINATQLCAGEALGGKDTCQGDSGGPLVVSDGAGGYTQVGVVSYGEGCASAGYYGVYTRVSSFSDWISASINSGTLTPRIYLPMLVQ